MSKYCVIQTYQGKPCKLVIKQTVISKPIPMPFNFNPAKRKQGDESHWERMSSFTFQEALKVKKQMEEHTTLYTFVMQAALIFHNPKRSFKTFKPRKEQK